MARMHSRKKGKSGSTRPIKSIPEWVTYNAQEVEKLIVKYAKQGNSASVIGMILRDSHAIPSVHAITGKRIAKVLAENNMSSELPEDMLALVRKLSDVKDHFEKNKQDKTALRGYQLTFSKIRRLTKYYNRNGTIAKN